MTALLWPKWLDNVWAKSPEKKGKPGETLSSHTYAVLERLFDLIRLRPYLPETVGFPDLWHSLFWACWFHDFGKAARGFQKVLRAGGCWPHRHEVLSLAFIDWVSDGFTEQEILWIGAGVAFHHKDPDDIKLLYLGPRECSEESIRALVDDIDNETLEGLWRWTKECSCSWMDTLGASGFSIRPIEVLELDTAISIYRNKAVDLVRKRLRSLQRWVRDLGIIGESNALGLITLRGHLHTCDHTGSARTGRIEAVPVVRNADMLSKWGLSVQDLYDHQRDCLHVNGSAILVAPTGSGKTEASLLWAHSGGLGDHLVPRLFYTLPYQASMNAMYDRLCINYPGQVGLEHGRSALALYRRYLNKSGDSDEAMRSARVERNLARLHYHPVRVMSPYQMLKAPYRLRGYESLLTDFFGAAFIFDEIHAYEVQRLAAILATVKYLRERFRARFLVMSATLPSLLRKPLFETLGTDNIIRASADLYKRFCRHRLLVQEGDLLECLESISLKAKEGNSILICCNTVKRAQTAYEQLLNMLNSERVLLLHGRFNARDRLAKERAVQIATGSDSKARHPIVLVSTQVVEVSLNIDLDIIYTDPAPLDALIQRFGRINRRRLKEWAPVNVFCEPAECRPIYEDELISESLKVLKKNADKLIIEEQISEWLDQVYRGGVAERWNQEFQEKYADFERSCLHTLRPFDANVGLERLFYQAFDSIEVLPACLEEEFSVLLAAGKPFESQELLVPISWNQFERLERKGLVRNGLQGCVKIVEAPYSCQLGLKLTAD